MKEEFVTSVFTRCRERLRLTARRLLGNDDDADDALQETFCRLWGKREALRDEAAVEGTTVTTLRNICIDSLRRSAAHPADSVDDQLAAIEARAGLEADQEETELRYAEIAELIDRRLSPRDSQIIYTPRPRRMGFRRNRRTLRPRRGQRQSHRQPGPTSYQGLLPTTPTPTRRHPTKTKEKQINNRYETC